MRLKWVSSGITGIRRFDDFGDGLTAAARATTGERDMSERSAISLYLLVVGRGGSAAGHDST
jgi:hypothetical protein